MALRDERELLAAVDQEEEEERLRQKADAEARRRRKQRDLLMVRRYCGRGGVVACAVRARRRPVARRCACTHTVAHPSVRFA